MILKFIMLLWRRMMARKNTRVLLNLRRVINKMATKCLDITLTDEKILIKLNKLIKNKKQLDLSLSDSLNLIGPFATQNEYY